MTIYRYTLPASHTASAPESSAPTMDDTLFLKRKTRFQSASPGSSRIFWVPPNIKVDFIIQVDLSIPPADLSAPVSPISLPNPPPYIPYTTMLPCIQKRTLYTLTKNH